MVKRTRNLKKRVKGSKNNTRYNKKHTRKHKKSTKSVKKNTKPQVRKMRRKKIMKGGEIFSGNIDQARVRNVSFYVIKEDERLELDYIGEKIRDGLIDAGLRVNDVRVTERNEKYRNEDGVEKTLLIVEVRLPLDLDINTSSSSSDYVRTEDSLMELLDLLEDSFLFRIRGISYNGPTEDTLRG